MRHITTEQFEQQLSTIQAAPQDQGVLKLIVIRPAVNDRQILEACELSLKGGAHGDMWARGTWMSLPDGSPHPDIQLTLMNYRVLEAIATSDMHRALAGDNLCLDFDLSEDNVTCGDRLQIGKTVVLQLTGIPHNGCHKFKRRFGADALAYVNSPLGRHLHLRGVYARVEQGGTVTLGDSVVKIGR